MTDIFGMSGRNLLTLLINEEEITEEKIEGVVYTSLKFKVPEIVEGLTVFLDVIDMNNDKSKGKRRPLKDI